MLDNVKQCLLKYQSVNDNISHGRHSGIDKKQFKDLMKPKILESWGKMKSKVLEDIKPFTSGQDMSEVYNTPKVIDDGEMNNEIEVI